MAIFNSYVILPEGIWSKKISAIHNGTKAMCVKEPEYLLIRIPTCFVPLFWSLLARLCDPAWLPSQKIGSVSLGLMNYHTIQYWLVIVENGIPSNALLDSDSGWIHTIQPESQMFCPFLSHWNKKTQEFCRPQSWCLWGHYSIALLCPNWDANEKPGIYKLSSMYWRGLSSNGAVEPGASTGS